MPHADFCTYQLHCVPTSKRWQYVIHTSTSAMTMNNSLALKSSAALCSYACLSTIQKGGME